MSRLDELKKQKEETKDVMKPRFDVSELRKHIDTIKPKETKTQEIKEPEHKPETKPVVDKPINAKFETTQDRKKIIDKVMDKYKLKGIRLRRREKKMILNMEQDASKNSQGIVIGLAVVGIIFVMVLRNFLPNEAMFTLVILLGATMFLPVGMIAGWFVFDPIMRCKILRRVSRRNYGIISLVGKGLKMIQKIKNFDEALIWRGNECWVLTKDKIGQITKDGDAINEGKVIDPASIVTMVDTVPIIFIDLDSMEPLSLSRSGRIPVHPLEIGSSLKAWTDNQRAKMMSNRKTLDTIMMIVVACAAGAIVVSVLTMQKVEEMKTVIETLQQQITDFIQQQQGFS